MQTIQIKDEDIVELMSDLNEMDAKSRQQVEQLKSDYRGKLGRYLKNEGACMGLYSHEAEVLSEGSVLLEFDVTLECVLCYNKDGFFLAPRLLK